ncbi:Rho GTPase-activating protein [Rhizina undulata]
MDDERHRRQLGIQSAVSVPGEPSERDGDASAATTSPLTSDLADTARLMESVLHSDIGVQSLLVRLKQSIASCRDFARFLERRAYLEEEHGQGLRKLCRMTVDSVKRPDSRQGSYVEHFDEMLRIHDKIAETGIQFSLSLHQMHEDLTELGNQMDRNRKMWKQQSTSAEKKVLDAEQLMEKAKSKYDTLADEFDRVRSGDRRGNKFGFKGSKTGPQYEEDLHRRLIAADQDYAMKVHNTNLQRQDLVKEVRPHAVRILKDMIAECDAGLTAQLQKFALLNEKLTLSNGLNVSPMKNGQSEAQSMRDVVYLIDNEKDFINFVLSLYPKMPPASKNSEIRYERHPSLTPQQDSPVVSAPSSSTSPQKPPPPPPPSQPPQQHQQHPQFTQQHQQQQQYTQQPQQQQQYQPYQPHQQQQKQHFQQHFQQQQPQLPQLPQQPQQPQHYPQQYQQYQQYPQQQQQKQQRESHPIPQPLAPRDPPPQSPQLQQNYQAQGFGAVVRTPAIIPAQSPEQMTTQYSPSAQSYPDLPRTRHVFGANLETLVQMDGTVVPIIVTQCIQAVDLYGTMVEGIYRLSAEKKHVDRIRAIFENDPSNIDFQREVDFFYDVNSVASVLKMFFRDLPEPLLTNQLYAEFIGASKIDDDIIRRDSLHALINRLPDPNYATLRALVLHLYRVQTHSQFNRMNAGNLAICFGPTLMGSNSTPNIADAGLQVLVVETILQNCYSIFDEEE